MFRDRSQANLNISSIIFFTKTINIIYECWSTPFSSFGIVYYQFESVSAI